MTDLLGVTRSTHSRSPDLAVPYSCLYGTVIALFYMAVDAHCTVQKYNSEAIKVSCEFAIESLLYFPT